MKIFYYKNINAVLFVAYLRNAFILYQVIFVLHM